MSDAADGIIDLYSRRALEWDADRGKTLIEKRWLDAFLAHILPGGSILDLGCGSGEPVARYLIEQRRRLTGVDAAPGLIDLCRRRFPDHDWRVADMRGLALDRTFDGAIAWHSAFHLTPGDQKEMFAVYARHVAPGGVLMFTSGRDEGETVGEWRGEPLYRGSLSAAEYRAALDASGFDLLDNRIDDPETGGATVWLARARMAE